MCGGLPSGGALEAQTFNIAQMYNRSTSIGFSTVSPSIGNRC